MTPRGFRCEIEHGVAHVTLERPDRLNALTFEIYDELARTFEGLDANTETRAVVLSGAGKGFCSGGDVDDIIAQLFSRDMRGLLEFTRATGRLIGSIRKLRRPVLAAVHGAAVGAGAVMAAACDLRIAAKDARFGFVFPRVGLSGADMGASHLLPRIVGLGNASELLFFGDIIDADTALRMGFVNRVVEDARAAKELARAWAARLARGPAFAHSMTKRMLESESTMTLDQALEAEAQAQAICMAHPDFRIAHEAFKTKTAPRFEGAPVSASSAEGEVSS